MACPATSKVGDYICCRVTLRGVLCQHEFCLFIPVGVTQPKIKQKQNYMFLYGLLICLNTAEAFIIPDSQFLLSGPCAADLAMPRT